MRTLVLLNRGADGGKAAIKWRRLEPDLRGLLGGSPTVCVETEDWAEAVDGAASADECLIVAAGGDGTVHKVADLILAISCPVSLRIVLGAIGLGSSNDFHKPQNGAADIAGVPVRCAIAGAAAQNVLRVAYVDDRGAHHVKYAVTSCSLGMVAAGNDLFNRCWGPVGLSRRLSAAAGIGCASLAGLLHARDPSVQLWIDGSDVYRGQVSLLSVYINPHFAGRLRYLGPTSVSSPYMGIVVVPAIGLWRRVGLLRRAAGVGLGAGGDVQTWEGISCEMKLNEASPLEIDGEVVRIREARVMLVPGALRVCR